MMIISRDTINAIATWRYKGYGVATIAQLMRIPAADVAEAIKTWRL
jgi:hypothetical protein